MTFISTQNGEIRQVSKTFVDACGLLKGMEDIFDDISTAENAIPLITIPDAVLDDIIRFEQSVLVVQDINIDAMPGSINGFFAHKSPRDVVELWRAADYLDYAYMERAACSYLANLVRYCEPSRVATLFEIDSVPDIEDVESFLLRNPFLREN